MNRLLLNFPRQNWLIWAVLVAILASETLWSGGILAAGSQPASEAAGPQSVIPSPVEVVHREIFIWVVLGAFCGYVMNARSANYEGVKSVFEKHGFTAVPGWVTIVFDIAFFALLGPVIVTAAYSPQELFQGVTLGLGWPLVIRGAMANLNG